MLFATLPITFMAIVGLVYAWALTDKEMRAVKVCGRTETIALLSVFAVTMQVLLLVVMFSFGIGTIERGAIELVSGFELLFFLLALPCALMRKGPVRWWLALASIYFMALGGFVYLVSGIEF
jgi:uncharacterized Tic20 family protein